MMKLFLLCGTGIVQRKSLLFGAIIPGDSSSSGIKTEVKKQDIRILLDALPISIYVVCPIEL